MSFTLSLHLTSTNISLDIISCKYAPDFITVCSVYAWSPLLQYIHSTSFAHKLNHYTFTMTLQNTCLTYKFNKFHPPKFLLPHATNTVTDVKIVSSIRICFVCHLSVTDNISRITKIKYNLPDRMWSLQKAGCYWWQRHLLNTCKWKYYRMSEVTPSNPMQPVY
jgi:hypothetical protein